MLDNYTDFSQSFHALDFSSSRSRLYIVYTDAINATEITFWPSDNIGKNAIISIFLFTYIIDDYN